MLNKCKTGDRVGAIGKADCERAYIYGFGTYSEEIPPPDPRGERGMVDFVHHANVTNPKITLDDGTVIWGAECWWGPEKEIKEFLKGLKTTIIKPPYELQEPTP